MVQMSIFNFQKQYLSLGENDDSMEYVEHLRSILFCAGKKGFQDTERGGLSENGFV